jgi:hypothetical protein
MFESGRKGFLLLSSGKPVTAAQLARMTGCATDEVSRLLSELEYSGVFSRLEDGTIYCRRMARDEHCRDQNRERVRKHRLRTGAGPPLRNEFALHNSIVTPVKRSCTEEEEEEEVISSSEGQEGGPGETTGTASSLSPAAELAQLFAFRYRGYHVRDKSARELVGEFEGLLRIMPAQEIRAAILDRNRRTDEQCWQFKKRWEASQNGGHAAAGHLGQISRVRAEDGTYGKTSRKIGGVPSAPGTGADSESASNSVADRG